MTIYYHTLKWSKGDVIGQSAHPTILFFKWWCNSKKILNYFICQTGRVTFAGVSVIFWNSLQKALLNKSLGNFQTRLYISHSYYDALILIFDKWSKLETTNILNSYSRNQSLSNHLEVGSNDTSNVSLLGFIWRYTF